MPAARYVEGSESPRKCDRCRESQSTFDGDFMSNLIRKIGGGSRWIHSQGRVSPSHSWTACIAWSQSVKSEMIYRCAPRIVFASLTLVRRLGR